MQKTTIIINENHTLLPEQENILKKRFREWETLLVPSDGWNKHERDEICHEIKGNVVFVSPIAGMIKDLTMRTMINMIKNEEIEVAPYVFSNDKRDKMELPNGKIIPKVAETGWYLE